MATSVKVETEKYGSTESVEIESEGDVIVLFATTAEQATPTTKRTTGVYVGKDQALKLAAGLIKFARKLED